MVTHLPALVVALTVLLLVLATWMVGRARGRYGVKAPATTGHADFERVETGRQGLKSQLPFVVGHRAGRSADERGGAEGDLRPGKDAALSVCHGADQRAGEPLRQSGSRYEQTRSKEKKKRTPPLTHT